MVKHPRFAALSLFALAMVALFVVPADAQDSPTDDAISAEAMPPVSSEILRSPVLSPDGGSVAFGFDGDIWTGSVEGGDARRLTITEDNDSTPLFSPDGKWIAFRSNRFGSSDLFYMPADGGPAKRLTYDDIGNTPVTWLPDSSGLLFTGYKQTAGATLQCVRLGGGNAWPVIRTSFRENISDAAISSDGSKIAYVRRGGSTSYRQRGYFGSSNNDIWVADFDGVFTSNHRRITTSKAHDFAPEFANDSTLIFCTFDNGKGGANRISHVVVKGIESDEAPQSVPFGAKDIRSVSVASKRVLMSTGSYGGWGLYLFEEAGDKLTRLKFNLRRDDRTVHFTSKTFKTSEGFSVSPDGKKVAFLAGYDVYLMPTAAGGVPKRLTNTNVREHNIQWAPDSKHICFTRSNIKHASIRIMNTQTGEEGYVSSSANVHSALFSPDKKWLYYVKNNFTICRSPVTSRSAQESHAFGDIYLGMIIDTSKEITIVENNFFMFSGMGTWGDGEFGLSHDGRWLTFLKENERYDTELWVCDMDADWPIMDTPEGVKTTKVSQVSGSAQEAKRLVSMFGGVRSYSISRDGKHVGFTVNTEGGYDNGDANIWTIATQRAAVTFAEDKLDEALKDKKPAAKNGKPAAAKDAKKDSKKANDIDFKDIRRRLRQSTRLAGSENWVVGAKRGFFFTSGSDIWSLTVSDSGRPSTRQITKTRKNKGNVFLDKSGNNLWFLDGGVITTANASSGATRSLPFSVVQRRDKRELREVAIAEGEGIIRDWFYDKNYHGLDIKKTFARYGEALSSVSTGDEYGALMGELFGELNASHQGYTAPDSRTDGYREQVGYLGLCFEERGMSEGKFIVRKVVRDGPCEQVGVDVKAGDLITHINGKEVNNQTPIEKLLLDTVGKRTILKLKRGTNSDLEAKVKPITYQAFFGLFYGDWVNDCRELVHRESKGQLGYVHIQGMNKASLIRFKHELGAEMLGKKGVLVDVRHNGGGRTAVQVLDILYSKPWLESVTRHKRARLSENVKGSVKLEKPTLMLCNQNSFSNAEMITEGFKELGLGKVVGMPTAGGVIWTWSSYALSDGASMRVTARGVYDMRGQNLENNGRTPTIEVDISPEDSFLGRDPQLVRGVKELLADTKE